MLDAHDPQMRALLLDIAEREGIDVNEGVYLGLMGPNFETPAEVRLFASWGADTVAMSVVEEVIAARQCGHARAGPFARFEQGVRHRGRKSEFGRGHGCC